jgi:hypothetical protein
MPGPTNDIQAAITPGPWYVRYEVLEVFGEDRTVIEGVEVGSNLWHSYDQAELNPADAYLIAAAPDLLDAAEMGLAVAESWIHSELDGTKGGQLEDALDALQPIRAAIERALAGLRPTAGSAGGAAE